MQKTADFFHYLKKKIEDCLLMLIETEIFQQKKMIGNLTMMVRKKKIVSVLSPPQVLVSVLVSEQAWNLSLIEDLPNDQ